MDKHLLAQQLRQRQYAHGHLPRHLIDAVSDEDMIDRCAASALSE